MVYTYLNFKEMFFVSNEHHDVAAIQTINLVYSHVNFNIIMQLRSHITYE